MKKPFLLLISLFCFPHGVFAQSGRVVTADFQQVFENYSELRELDQQMRAELQAFRDGQEEKLKALRAQNEQFQQIRNQAAAEGISAEEREELIERATEIFESLRREEQALQQKQQAFNQEMEARAARMRREVVDTVLEHVEEMSRERGWDLVVDASARGANGLPVVLFADPGMDVTREVVRSLNRAAAEEAEETEEDAAEDPPAGNGEAE